LKEKACRKLYRALLKYPRGIWRKEVLSSEFLSDESMAKAEIRYIKIFDSKNQGYNLTDGGEGTSGTVFTREIREKMRQANLGKKHSFATKRKISRIVKGRKHSAESKARMSLAQMGNTKAKG
jgi:NUMOD3 motif